MFIDVDGYCVGGVDQREIVSAQAEGYRARELGWAFFAHDECSSGSIYFSDLIVKPIRGADPGVRHVQKNLHGLPVSPGRGEFGSEIVTCSSRLLDAIRTLYEVFTHASQRPVVIVHKGGNEGLWAARAIPHKELLVVDLGKLGCPKVDDLGHAQLSARRCQFHTAIDKKREKKVHCPRLEVWLLAFWVATEMMR